ncbi:MAG TPA: diguanylate cyclase [Solirubrobacteraceae bacterium]|jgi:ribonuclease P protein subunit RPR2
MKLHGPAFRELPLAARALIAVAVAAAGAAAGAATRPLDVALLAVTAALCLAAAFFEADSPGSSSLHPGLAFVFWAAVLLPGAALPLLAALCFVPSALRGRARWYVPVFHAAACVLAGLAAHPLAALGGDRGAPRVAALAGAAAVFVLVVDALLVALRRAGRGRTPGAAVRDAAANLPLDLALVSTGAALAVLWSADPWLSAILAGPIALVSRALLVPGLRHKSRTDSKTGLFNFEHLRATLDDALRAAERRGEPVAVVMVDLDHLRAINNRFGHLAGDEAILRVARVLGAAADDRGHAARFGGEEFCLLLPGHSAAAAEALVDAARLSVQSLSWEDAGEQMRCTFSAGVAAFPQDGASSTELLAAADRALYDAKSGGRNRVRLALPPEALEDVDLAAAIEHGPPAAEAPSAPAPPPAADEPEPAEAGAAELTERGRPAFIPGFVGALLAAVVAVVVLTGAPGELHSPLLLAVLVAAVVALDVVRIDLFEGLNLSAASVPTLTLACLFGPVGPITAEVAIAVVRCVRREPRLRWSFDLGALGLAGSAAAGVFAVLPGDAPLPAIFAGLPAALAYYAVNVTLMAVVVSLAEGARPLHVWRESMAWLWAHYLLYGALGAGLAVVAREMGIVAVAPFALPVVALWLGQRQYVSRERASVVRLRRSHDALENANERLQRLVDEKRELLARVHGSYLSTITSLARTIEAKDPCTGGHTERVSRVTMLLAGELGLPQNQRRAAEVGATIHDIGKVGVPDAILLKPDGLTDAEFAVMRRHPEISSYIVGALDVPPVVKQMVRSHHERYDGLGYPDGLAGEEIPLAARILAVADTLDAITSDRPYRPACGLEVAIEEITSLAGQQFCPSVVAALIACLDRDPTLGGLYEHEPSLHVVA